MSSLPSEPGSYALIFSNTIPRTIRVGALGEVPIEPGFLIYVGSALGPGGIRARVMRHTRKSKTLHWHIDYLRQYLTLDEVWLTIAKERREHTWADRLTSELEIVFPRFGASDCRCDAHLFFSAVRPDIRMLGVKSPKRNKGESVLIWRPSRDST